MQKEDAGKKEGRVKKLLRKLFEGVDEKMKQGSSSTKGCCAGNSEGKGNSCCS